MGTAFLLALLFILVAFAIRAGEFILMRTLAAFNQKRLSFIVGITKDIILLLITSELIVIVIKPILKSLS